MASVHLASFIALLLVPLGASAGLSLDTALQRHRAWTDAGASLSASTPQLTLPDSLTVGVASSHDNTPPLLRPVVRDRAGTQLLLGGESSDAIAWRLGVAWADRAGERVGLDGSELSLKLGAGRAYLSQQRRHWGLAWAGSLILDEGAAPVPTLGWRKTDAQPLESPWLAWMGPLNADVFVGGLSGHTEPARPRLWGARVQFMPIEGLEIGVSRVLEWGGHGRSESLATLWKAVTGRDNVEGGVGDPSNQLGGFDLRYTRRIDAGRAWSVYAQAIGEDEAGHLPSRYIGSAGIDVAFRSGGTSARLLAEHANTISGGINGDAQPGSAYRHSTYRQGYTQRGRPLGFPAGGDVTLSTLGLLVDHVRVSAIALWHLGRAHEQAQLFAPGRLGGADAELAWHLDAANSLGGTLTVWRAPGTRVDRLQLWWRHALD